LEKAIHSTLFITFLYEYIFFGCVFSLAPWTTTLSFGFAVKRRLLDDDDYDDNDDYEERAKGTAETALSNPGASEEAR
jgi:hypothetical protein